MNEELFGLLGINPESAKEKAFTKGLLGAIAQAAALSGPQARPVGNLQGLGQIGLAGLGAYESSFDKQLKEALTGLQVKDLITKQKESQQLRTLLPQVFQTTRAPSQTIYDVEGETTIPGAVTSVKIDPARLQALMMIPGGAEAVRGLAETQKLVRQAGLTTGAQEAPSPFAPYLTAQSPEVRKLAETYTNALKSGAIDEETAYKRIEPLAKMEDTFVARQAATLARNEARRNAAADRELKREEGTTEKAKAAGFAQTMVQADTLIEDLVSKYDKKVLPTNYTSAAGSVPFVGGRLERAAMSSEQQQFKNAADAWIRSKLRFESGAAIGENEMRQEYETYFPMPGDSTERIDQKAELRKTATSNMIRNAGQLFKPAGSVGIKDIRSKSGLE
jgi:HPt (histidine-containing phosphotransfer) domain-containing protein